KDFHAGQLDQSAGIKQGEEIDDACLLREAVAEVRGSALGDFGCQCAENRKSTQAKAGVVQIRTAFTARETAVDVLSGAGIHSMAGAEVGRQAIRPACEMICEIQKIGFVAH